MPLRRPWLLLLLFALLAPVTADACPVCFSAKEGSRIAFIVTTVFMSVLPWVMVGSFVVWYRRRCAEEEKTG